MAGPGGMASYTVLPANCRQTQPFGGAGANFVRVCCAACATISVLCNFGRALRITHELVPHAVWAERAQGSGCDGFIEAMNVEAYVLLASTYSEHFLLGGMT